MTGVSPGKFVSVPHFDKSDLTTGQIMITTERKSQIITQLTLGSMPKPASDEEKIFIDKVSIEIDEMMSKGIMPVIPQD